MTEPFKQSMQNQTAPLRELCSRWLELFVCGLFLAPVALVPLIFSDSGTNALVIKDPLFQIPAALLLLLIPFSNLRKESAPRFFLSLLFLFGVYLFISAVFIAAHPRAWMELIRWFACIAFAWTACAYCAVSKRRQHFLILTLAASALVSAYAILQAFEIEPFLAWGTFSPEGSDIRRVCSSLCNPDYLAGYLVGVIPLTAALALYQRGAIRVVCALLTLMHLFALFFTYSRGGWAAMLASFGLLGLVILFRPFYYKQNASLFQWKHLLSASAVAMLALVCASFFLRDELSGWAYRFSNLSNDMSIQSRAYFYLGCFKMWLDQPLIGHGLGTFSLNFHEFRPKELAQLMTFRVFQVDHAHNEFLEILSETGLIGFALYASIIASSFCFCWRATKTASLSLRGAVIGLCLGAAAILVHNLFTVTLRYTPSAFLLWSFLGAAVGTASTQIDFKPPSKLFKTSVYWVLFLCAPILFFYTMNFYVGDYLIHEGTKRLYTKIHFEQSREQNRVEMQRALVSLYKAMDLSPSRVEALFYIGLSYNKALDYIQADRIYREVQAIHPHFTAVLMNLSINRMQWGTFINNHAYFPEKVPGYAMLVPNELRKAAQWAEMGAQDDPYDPVYPHLIGRSYYYLGELDKAKLAFQQTIDKSMTLSEDMYRNEISDSRTFLDRIQQIEEMQKSHDEQ
ncbi:O-antigen ligase family protein [bacterium]|nr:O-antigen ligase family protein [bacterium]